MTSTPDSTPLEAFRALWRAWIGTTDTPESIAAWPDPWGSWAATHPAARVHPGVQGQSGPSVISETIKAPGLGGK